MARRLDSVRAYRRLFGEIYPSVHAGGRITFQMFAEAIAEFDFTLTFADAPIDEYARGRHAALTAAQKRGALLFFGAAGCVACHNVSGRSSELFTDFREHAIGVPQLVPSFTNNQFDGREANEDFGREDATGNPADRYEFRTPSLRNVAVQPAFMHDGAYTTLRAAIRHHLDVATALRSFDPAKQGLPADLTGPVGPVAPLLGAVDPRLAKPITLTPRQLDELVAFVRGALLDPRAVPERLGSLVPAHVPSGRATLKFEFGTPTSRIHSRRAAG